MENARNLLNSLFFDPKRYDLTKVGRYKLNQRLGVDVPEGASPHDAGHRPLVAARPLPKTLGVPEDSKDYAADSILSRDPIRASSTSTSTSATSRLRTVGELIQEAFGSASTAWSASSASG